MNLFSSLGKLFTPSPPLDAETRAALAQALAVDRSMLAVSGYEKKLAGPVRRALAYSRELVQGIPGPMPLNVRSFGADPLIHALFAAPEDIERMLGVSVEARRLVNEARPAADAVYGLIGMRRKEKVIPGLEVHGNVIEEGPPKHILYFGDHTLHELDADIAETRSKLQTALFDSLVKSFTQQLDEMRARRVELHKAWDVERSRARDLAADNAGKLDELAQEMRRAAESLQPGRILDAFAAWLAAPESRLRLEDVVMSVDRMGVIRNGAAALAQDVNTLNLHELVSRDRRRWIVLIACIATADIEKAQRESAKAGRYIII